MTSVIFAVAGTAGLILLSIFDTLHHPHLHDGFLLLFIAGYVISAIFICAEYQRLGVHFRQHRILRLSFWLKLTFIIVEILLAIVFVSTSFKHHQNIAAVFEWVIALIFTGYVLTFFIDLLPAARSTQAKTNEMVLQQRMDQDAMGDTEGGYGYGDATRHGNGHAINGNAYAVADGRHKAQHSAANF